MRLLHVHANRIPNGFTNGEPVQALKLFNREGTPFGWEISKTPFKGSNLVVLKFYEHASTCNCDECRGMYSVWDQIRFRPA